MAGPRDPVIWCLGQLGELEAVGHQIDAGTIAQVCRRLDPLVRRFVRGRVTTAYQQALDLCGVSGAAHTSARVAFLERLEGFAASDKPDAVIQAFATRHRPCRPPPWRLTAATVVVLLLAAGAAGFVGLAPDYLLDAELEKPRADAYNRGGRPLPGDAAQRAFFSEALPEFVVAFDRHRPGADSESAEALPLADRRALVVRRREGVVAAASAALGGEIAQRLDALLGVAIAAVFDAEALADGAIARATQAFNAALAEAGWGFHIDVAALGSDAGRIHRFLIASFVVEWVERYRSGETAVRALRWNRLDTLAFERSLLGFTREDLDDALVLMDRIDAWMVRAVLPALRADAPLILVDDATLQEAPAWLAPLQRVAGAEVRRQLGQAVGDADALADIGDLLAQRDDLMTRWNVGLRGRGIQVAAPEHYAVNMERYANIEKALLPTQWSELVYLQRRLEGGRFAATHRALRRTLAKSVERHEVQHRLDFAHARIAVFPDALAEYVRPPPPGEVPTGLARSSNAELSAYLAELARSATLVKTNLAAVGRFIFDRHNWGRAESFAALVIFGELARRHGRADIDLVQRRLIDRPKAAEIFAQLVAVDDGALARSAGEAWRDLYGEELPPLEIATAAAP